MRHSARLFVIVATVLGVVTLTAACGSGGSSSATSRTKVVGVTFSGDDVSPNGELVHVALGQRVELEIEADKAGQLHVRSNPEQQKDYGAGTTRISLGSFDVPGRVTVESHALGKTIVILEIR